MGLSLQILKPILLESKLVNEEQFNDALDISKRTGQDVADLLISQGYLTKEYLTELISLYLKIPKIKLKGRSIDPKYLNMLTEQIARSKKAVVFGEEGMHLQVALVDPSNLDSVRFLESYLNRPVKVYITTEEELREVFSYYRQQLTEKFKSITEKNVKEAAKLKSLSPDKAAVELPIVSLVDTLIEYAASLNATDIHIEIMADFVLIRFRIDGLLKEIITLPKETHPAILARVKIMANMKIDEHQRPQDSRFKFKQGDDVFDIRVSVLPTYFGEKINMRLLLGALKPLSLFELGMNEKVAETVVANIKRTYGMILVTGPTGSGKTTTLYSILSILNKPEVNIVTVENPVEYELKYINQVNVNPQADLTFATSLRSILRQDPDIIMVGEIRDSETANIAINAALTGHLVLSTLHTNDAATAIPRLIDLGVPPFLVSATVNLIIAQRLVRRICKDCVASYDITPEVSKSILNQLQAIDENHTEADVPTLLYKGLGCSSCGGKGSKGRVGIYEVLNVSDDMRGLIQEDNFSLEKLRNLSRTEGMKVLFENGLKKAELGLISLEELFRVVRES